MYCKNCNQQIADARKEVKCTICKANLHRDCSIKENDLHYCDICFTVKEQEKPRIEFEMPKTIRRSYIEDYKSCPYKFYLTTIRGINDDSETIYNHLGTDLHSFFESASNDKNYYISDMLLDYARLWDSYEIYGLSDELKNTMYNRGLSCINNFYEVLSTLPEFPHATEVQTIFNVGEDLPQVSATIDRVDLIDDMLELSDWKTGQILVGNKLTSDMQAPLYIYGAESHFNIPVRKFTFYYLQDNKTRVFERQADGSFICTVKKRIYRINPNNAVKEVQSLFSQIKKGNFNIPNDTKKMYYTCKICNHRTSGNCEGADIQAWKQLQ